MHLSGSGSFLVGARLPIKTLCHGKFARAGAGSPRSRRGDRRARRNRQSAGRGGQHVRVRTFVPGRFRAAPGSAWASRCPVILNEPLSFSFFANAVAASPSRTSSGRRLRETLRRTPSCDSRGRWPGAALLRSGITLNPLEDPREALHYPPGNHGSYNLSSGLVVQDTGSPDAPARRSSTLKTAGTHDSNAKGFPCGSTGTNSNGS
jgi:hypothetical protein